MTIELGGCGARAEGVSWRPFWGGALGPAAGPFSLAGVSRSDATRGLVGRSVHISVKSEMGRNKHAELAWQKEMDLSVTS